MARHLSVLTLMILLLAPTLGRAQTVPTPEQFFGFKIGTDGELATYPKILEYFALLAKQTDRVKFEVLGKTTLGHDYALLRISAPQNSGVQHGTA